MLQSKKSTSLLSLNVRLFAMSFGLLVLLSGVSLYGVYEHYIVKVQQQHLTKQRLLLEERIDKKEKILHAATLVIANNSKIRQELAYENREAIIAETGHLQEEFGRWTGSINYAFHVITFDGRSLYRNYDMDSFGQDVSSHPMMKQAMADTSRAVTQIGKGGYGNVYRVINIQPVYALDQPDELVGFMTVSQGLKQIVQEFAQDGLGYYVFERQQTDESDLSGRFLVDKAGYFANREASQWSFEDRQINHQQVQLRDGYYYMTYPIYDQQQLVAFHLVLAPKSMLNDQAWDLTLQVFWILMIALLTVVLSGVVQLGLLRSNVLKPIRLLTSSLNRIIETERYDQPVENDRHDEIGLVTQLFNKMISQTDKLIFDLRYQKMAIDKTLIISRADVYGTITDVNDNFCKISGYSREELIGKPHNIVRHPDMDKAVFANMWKTIQSKHIWQGEVKNRRKDGSSYYVMSYIIPILNRDDEIQEYLSIREDITLIVELREGLQDALVQAESDKLVAEKASRAKSDFLASMSHELRTPLNAIIGYAQLLELAKLDPRSQQQIQTISSSSKHLLALINDILDYAKLESGKVQFNFEKVSLSHAVADVVTLCETQIAQSELDLKVEPISEQAWVSVDPLRFKQVLLNILSNAIKYNRPKGAIRIRCHLSHQDDKTYWTLDIEDSGEGIDSQDLAHLFEPFNRLGHENSTIQGTGIGLSISKDLIEQMHGFIQVRSVKGQGTTFSLLLPTVEFDLASHDNKMPVASVTEQHNNRVLPLMYLGYDALTMQQLFSACQTLSTDDLAVELSVVPSFDLAMQQLEQKQPGLVIVDAALTDAQIGLQRLSERLPKSSLIQVYDQAQNIEQLSDKVALSVVRKVELTEWVELLKLQIESFNSRD